MIDISSESVDLSRLVPGLYPRVELLHRGKVYWLVINKGKHGRTSVDYWLKIPGCRTRYDPRAQLKSVRVLPYAKLKERFFDYVPDILAGVLWLNGAKRNLHRYQYWIGAKGELYD